MKRKLPIVRVILIVALIAATAVTTICVKSWIDKKQFAVEVRSTIDAKTIEERIRPLAELATLLYSYTDVGEFSEQNTIMWFGMEMTLPLTTKSFLIWYDCEMKIGLDTSQISVQLDDAEGVLTLVLPQAQLISHVIHEDSVKVYDEKDGLFNRINITDYTEFIVAQKQTMEDRAYQSGLFTQAQQNAEAMISTLLKTLPGVEGAYSIEFQ